MRVFLPALLLAASASAAPLPVALTDIGVAAAVRGAVSAVAPGQPKAVGRVVSSGKPLYLNDQVRTGKGGRLQIMLLDETTFTIGQDSEMLLDEFVYDPATNKGKVSAQIVKGAFRFVTGRIARRDVGDMKVGLPVGTIGIRGTIVEGVVHENGDADVALGGPGQDNNADENPGGITVSNGAGSVDIDHSGYMTSIRAGGRPTPPVRVTPEFKAQTDIVGTGAGGGDSGGLNGDALGGGEGAGSGNGSGQQASASEGSGDGAAQGDARARMLFEDAGSGQPEETQFAAQEAASGGGSTGLADGLGKWEDVQLLTGGGGNAGYIGAGTFSCAGGSCGGGDSGTVSFELAVDFTNKTVGGNGSSLSFSGGQYGDSVGVGPLSYSGLASGPATMSLTPGLSNSFFTDMSLQLNNKGGVAAKEAAVSFSYSGPEGEVASGSGKGDLGEMAPR